MDGEILILLSCGILGIFWGAQLTEAVLLVPYWKSLKADEFFAYYQSQGKRIHQFFAPLTIGSTLLPFLSVIYLIFFKHEYHILLFTMGLSTLAFFLTFYMYFKNANRRFTDRALTDEALPYELVRWGNWHWGRVSFEFIALGASLLWLFIL